MGRLDNKIALVTGASRGIGKAIALQLAKEGATVGIHYRDKKEEAEAVAELIKKMGGTVKIFRADFAGQQQVIAFGENAWKEFGRIDFLINNAGISYKKHFLDTSIEDIDSFINTNLKGTLLLTQTITRKMVESKTEGSVYTITSINGIQPGVGLSVYGATKGALEALMKGVALELAPHNIKVNTLAIGAIQTDINAAAWQDDETLKKINENIPLGRLGQPEEVAMILSDLLCSGSYLTGSTIKIDGGWMLRQGYVVPKPYDK